MSKNFWSDTKTRFRTIKNHYRNKKGDEAMNAMEGSVQWEREYEKGLERVWKEGKPLLLDFFKDG
jgi:hypothetical protein